MASKSFTNLNAQIPSEEEEKEADSPTGSFDSSPTSSEVGPPKQPTFSAPVSASGQSCQESSKITTATVVSSGTGPVNDIYKRIRRAERFGMPVQLSEEEKRFSRAERFGTGCLLNKSEAGGKSEELKRKARAERFGTSVSSVITDERAKRQARLARFAAVPDAVSPGEDKRKAKAIRFSNLPSSSISQVNGKAVIAGKASGGA